MDDEVSGEPSPIGQRMQQPDSTTQSSLPRKKRRTESTQHANDTNFYSKLGPKQGQGALKEVHYIYPWEVNKTAGKVVNVTASKSGYQT
jgi:hypothetical protein